MSWFTDNIRDPLENAIATGKLSGQAAPAVPTSNPPAKSNASFTSSPYFIPVAIVLAIIVIAHFLKKG